MDNRVYSYQQCKKCKTVYPNSQKTCTACNLPLGTFGEPCDRYGNVQKLEPPGPGKIGDERTPHLQPPVTERPETPPPPRPETTKMTEKKPSFLKHYGLYILAVIAAALAVVDYQDSDMDDARPFLGIAAVILVICGVYFNAKKPKN